MAITDDKTIGEVELFFRGTPAMFYAIVQAYEYQCSINGKKTALLPQAVHSEPAPNAVSVDINFHPGGITIHSLGRERSRVLVWMPRNNVEIWEEWGAFERELKRLDVIEGASEENIQGFHQKTESLRHKHSSAQRRAIVVHFLRDRAQNKIANLNAWAQANYDITARTLRNYRHEFPDEEI